MPMMKPLPLGGTQKIYRGVRQLFGIMAELPVEVWVIVRVKAPFVRSCSRGPIVEVRGNTQRANIITRS